MFFNFYVLCIFVCLFNLINVVIIRKLKFQNFEYMSGLAGGCGLLEAKCGEVGMQ